MRDGRVTAELEPVTFSAMPGPAIDDEFGLLHENAEEFGLAWNGPPPIERRFVEVEPGRQVSAVVWHPGAEPELVLVHGGAQNAHTWDTVALALDRPLVAVDLPGHGHSGWRRDHAYSPQANADDLAVALAQLVPRARPVVGMSLGGLTSIALAARHPHLVERLALVDVTPGVDHEKAEPIIAFISGPETFASFDEILERTVQFNPTRSVSSLRRGVLHNAKENPDGSWTWRWDPHHFQSAGGLTKLAELWDDLDRLEVPVLLARGSLSPVVSDDDVAELLRRRPGARVEVVEGAGHSIQGDRPLELAALLDEFLG